MLKQGVFRAAFLLLVAGVVACGAAADEAAGDGPVVVFMIGEDEYETERTLPAFAETALAPRGVESVFVHDEPAGSGDFEGLAAALGRADVLVISVRRRAIPEAQMDALREYLEGGGPLVAIRTSSHAFDLRGDDPPEGRALWPGFDAEVLGGRYENHYGNRGGTRITTADDAADHQILTGIADQRFESTSWLYRNRDLADGTQVLRVGSFTDDDGERRTEPVAWTHEHDGGRVYYTSLGHPEDFAEPLFQRELLNALYWAMGEDVPEAAGDATGAGAPPVMPDIAANPRVAELIRDFEGAGDLSDPDAGDPLPPDRALDPFAVHEGFTLELVAHEPAIRQPVHMHFDHRGRMWVVQYLQYPFPAGLRVERYDQYLRAQFDRVPPPPPDHFRGADKITLLEDTTGDGEFDTARDVLTGLNIVTSVAWGRGGLWVLNPPYLLFYPDESGDDLPDGEPRVHLAGFGLEDTHSVANSLTWGPDGWLYGVNGSTTTAAVRSVHHPAAARREPVRFEGQCVWRYHPETGDFEVYAEGGGNLFSLDIDSKGRVFSGTNTGHTRGMHYPQGGYGVKNWAKHGPLTNPYAFGYFDHMAHEGDRERLSMAFTVYEAGRFGERYEGHAIVANALHNRMAASRLIADGATFRTRDLDDLLLEGHRWFRPVHVTAGPDGALYIADWHDTRLSHLDPRDDWRKDVGRIYRLRPDDGAEPIAPFDLSALGSDQLIDLLAHDNRWFRRAALRVLADRRDDSLVPQLESLLDGESGQLALEALWALNLSGGFTEAAAVRALEHENPHVRRWAVRLLGDDRRLTGHIADRLARLAANEPDVEVRSQLASSARRLDDAAAGLRIVRALLERSEDASDRHIPLLLWWAIEARAETNREAVLAMFEESAVWDLPIVRGVIAERIMRRYATAGGGANLRACARLLELAPGPDDAERLMAGFQRAYRGRTIGELPRALADALDAYQRTVGESDIALGLRRGDEDALRAALDRIADESADEAERLLYIETLGELAPPEAADPLLRVLARTSSRPVQRVTLQALMGFDRPEIGRRIVDLYHTRLPDEDGVRDAAHRLLASRPEWAAHLLREVDAWRIAPEHIPPDVVHQLALHGDERIDRLVEEHWGPVRAATSEQAEREVERIAAIVASGEGDAAAGRAIYNARCAACHTLFGEGGDIGPDLTDYERGNLDFMVRSAVDPNSGLREEYTAFQLTTTDGRTLLGLVDDRDDRAVTLRTLDGQRTVIARDRIETLRALERSLMPEGLLEGLSDEDIRDLFAYLMQPD